MSKDWSKLDAYRKANREARQNTNFNFGSNDYRGNIRVVYNRATDADMVAGRAWYTLAYRTAQNIVGKDGDHKVGAGIIAAFSPQMAWKKNIELAAKCLRTNRFTGHYGANNRKARKIANGIDPLKVLGGDKTLAFYECIATAGQTDAVCIDRHAASVCLGRNVTDQERHNIRRKHYAAYANAYKDVAREVGLLASEVQAITWVTWRREKGIID